MFKIQIVAVFVLGMLLLCSCTSRQRIMYFSDMEEVNKTDTVSTLPVLRIQSGDILQVTISTMNTNISALYNPVANFVSANPAAQGYLVDKAGFIDLPQIGKVYVRGKTTDQINDAVKAEVDKLVKNAFVATRMLNFRVSVLGDVARPGNFPITNERLTVLEALSLAGDANLTARREQILLIREVEGKKTYVTLNLNDSKILSSPYYYLANNDVIYVRPGVNRVISTSTAVQVLPLVATAVTLMLVLYNNVKK